MDSASPTLDFYAFKHAYATIAKEGRDTAGIDLLGYFLQTEDDTEDQLVPLKLTGAVALLFVESDPSKCKCLRREKGKWAICTVATKIICRNVLATLKAHKKLARLLRS